MSGISDSALVLLTLNEAGAKINGRKRFQKIVCLLKYKYDIPFSFDFRAYYYGPYSDQLAELLDSLTTSKLVNEEGEIAENGYLQYQYTLTQYGSKLAQKLLRTQEGKQIARKIDKYLEVIGNLPIGELVSLSKQFTPAYQY